MLNNLIKDFHAKVSTRTHFQTSSKGKVFFFLFWGNQFLKYIRYLIKTNDLLIYLPIFYQQGSLRSIVT